MIIPFDILYEGFCNRVRSSGKSDTILGLIKKENNDCFRVKALLEEEPELYSLLERNICDCFERKDELQARKLWKRGLEGKSAELLTEAMCYCPLPPIIWEERIVPAFEQGRVKSTLERWLGCAMKEGGSDELLGGILYDRGCLLFNQRRFVSSLKDLLRAWLLGFPKTLEMSYQISVCFCELGELDTCKELMQCTAQHLRTLEMSNEEKSVWTMNIVKVLKVVEASRKQNSQRKSGNSGKVYELLAMASPSKAPPTPSSGISNFSSLYSGESERIRGMSDSLELKYSGEKGRHMVARQRIPPGSTIIAELPFAWTMSKSNYHKFCTWCLERIDAGIPCQSCASAIFCDAACRTQAMSSFHQKECRILKLLDSSQKLGNMALLCFRTILKTPLQTVQEFTKLIQPDGTALPEKVVMGLDDEDKLDSSSYLSVFSQTPNSEQRQAADLLKRTFSSVYLTLCLKYSGYLEINGDQTSPATMSQLEVDISAIILRHLQSASCNAYGINQIEKKLEYEGASQKNLQIEEIGGATYPIISTTNHNCNPNAYRMNVAGRMCLVKTLREIPPGEEIFDCYGPLYLVEGRQERMSKLHSQYLFRCGCLPCTEDWPSYGKLRQLPLQYKCPSCHCAHQSEGGGAGGNKMKCPYCDKVTDMKKLREALAIHRERFTLARASILAEAFQPFDKDLEGIICEYVELCQEAYLDPCIDSVEAQEVLKLFWNISIRNSS